MAFIVIITTIPNEIPFFSLYIGCAQSASVCVQSRIYQFPGFISFYRILFRERENGPTFQIRNQKIKRKINSLKMWTLERLAPSHTIEFQNKKWGKKGAEREKRFESQSGASWPGRAQKEEKRKREKFKTVAIKNPKKEREPVRRSRYGRTRQRARTISIQNKINISIVMRHNHLQLFV